ncbi:lipocalin family protein [Aquimarina aquimarini]|uniref:lipocalin family protein n=1 Tax=Aquimarina aquimarini TaxID=1191734 RepID=UPI000D55D521|nr:lipocalin family protein [Aquimarina aquimarini]
MKKLNLFILLIATIFISCSKDDDQTPETIEITEKNLIGKWQLTKIEEDGKQITLNPCDKKDISQFSIKEDGSKLAIFIGNSEINGECTPHQSTDYTWELSNNKFSTFILTGDRRNAEDLYTIIELTKTVLKTESRETYKDDQGNEKTSVYIETFTYIGKPDIEPSTVVNPKESNLIGKWQLTKSITDGKENSLNECELKYSRVYLSNGVVNWSDPYLTQPDQPKGCIESTGSLFWELVDNNIYFKETSTDANEDPEKILELTETVLKTSYTHESTPNTFHETIETYKKI